MAKANPTKQNWAHWLYIHHLATQFPELQPLDDNEFDRKFYQRPDNEVGIKDILSAAYGAPRTMVQFTPGHGGTTMFRAVLERLTSQQIRRLYVPIDVARYVDGTDEISDVIWADIHRNVFRQLVTRDWYPHLYAMTKQSFQLLFDSTGFTHFPDYLDSIQTRLLNSLPGDDEDRDTLRTFKYKPDLASLGSLFTTLFENLGVVTVLLFDIPRSAKPKHLLPLMGEIKAFDEQERKSKFPPAALTEVYFGTASSLTTLKTTYHREYHVVSVPPYTPAEVFAILTRHYGVDYGSHTNQSLITVLSASYLDDVWSSSKSLAEMMRDLKQSLLKRLDCLRDRVSFGMFQDPVHSPK